MSEHSQKLALFDFDGTLYKYDSILSFCLFYYQKKPWRVWRVVIQVFSWFFWKLGLRDTREFKARFICFIAKDSAGEIERIATEFWNKSSSFNPKLLTELQTCQANKVLPVVVSASPDLFILPACQNLGIKHVIATSLHVTEKGYSLGENCRGEEKIKRLRDVFPTHTIHVAYSDNSDDFALLQLAEHGYLIKNGTLIAVH